MAVLRISLKKITSEVKFAERKLALLQNNNIWKKKILPFVLSYKVTPSLHHPNNDFMSQWHLIQPLQRENTKLQRFNISLYSRQEQKSLVTYHALQSLYICVWPVNTLISTAPIGSPIICMRSPAVICEQWERNLSFSSADVCGAGMRDAPLRMFAGEASVVQPKIALQSNTKIDQVLAEKVWLQKISMPSTMDGHWKFWRKADLKLNLNCQRHGGKRGGGGFQARKLSIQRAWIHIFPRRMQLYSSAVCSMCKKVNYMLIVKVSMIANISVQSAYFWFQHKLFVKRSTWKSGYSFHLRMLKTEVIINDLQKGKKRTK